MPQNRTPFIGTEREVPKLGPPWNSQFGPHSRPYFPRIPALRLYEIALAWPTVGLCCWFSGNAGFKGPGFGTHGFGNSQYGFQVGIAGRTCSGEGGRNVSEVMPAHTFRSIPRAWWLYACLLKSCQGTHSAAFRGHGGFVVVC